MIFLDTSGIFALADSDDAMHHDANRMIAVAKDAGEQIMTHSYVLVESAALLQNRLGLKIALTFLEEAQLDRVGCFKFEPVRGAPANELDNPVPEEVKSQRYARFMETQQKISARRLRAKVGKREPVIIDSVTQGGGIGRTRGDAPEIDGVVHISSRRPLKVGEIATVKIDSADAYDLHGSVTGF